MSVFGIIWAILIALKIAGVGAVAAWSWWILIFWPVIPFLVFAAGFLLIGGAATSVMAFRGRNNRYRLR